MTTRQTGHAGLMQAMGFAAETISEADLRLEMDAAVGNRDAIALTMRHGLGSVRPHSYRQIGDFLRISHQLARCRVKSAEDTLHNYIRRRIRNGRP